MDRKVRIAIIGAGTAGLSAYKEAQKYTDDILVIDGGPLGSTCARIGCMPSKLLIQAANNYHQRLHFAEQGIKGAQYLKTNLPEVLNYVRKMRDKFTSGVVEFTQSLGESFLYGNAKFISPNALQVGDQIIHAESIIIACGSKSIIPDEWLKFQEDILTSETIFEQDSLGHEIGLIGAGSIGLEFGQALSRLGINISAFTATGHIGGISDPEVNQAALNIFQQEFPIYLNEKASLKKKNGQLYIHASSDIPVNQVIVAMGRKPNLANLGLQELGIELDEKGIPKFDSTTMQIQDSPLFLAGDVNHARPLLHEAADEGRIAAYNAINKNQCFKRRTPLRILFTEPNIVVVGKAYKELEEGSFIAAGIDFSNQGRAKILQQNHGLLRVYGAKKNGELLGAEMVAPGGEHLGHLLAWAIEQKMTVFDMLKMPFYHPVLEEGMRTALRKLSKQVEEKSSDFDLAMCDSEAIHSLS
ncbi:dihydrolipoyl dehydrogenase [Legionella londiniensis]|uniref:Dihydrolipoamide dehydrogenase n=1 Tax=Legionella londiniensis TaxID=45068 RepID=A0A0W0VM03_9GAMM|nr:dihydrolipoyl dehydrogenase [Legionella londiniensis]KTD21179.1 dihydrolipoamide dehydrogenase [Legionella londiniensis]STX93203.1 dihydrolipoamide dehydrogenase [Legionella londiniensis]